MTKIPMSEQIAQSILDHFQNEQGGKLLQSVLQDGMRKMVTEMVSRQRLLSSLVAEVTTSAGILNLRPKVTGTVTATSDSRQARER